MLSIPQESHLREAVKTERNGYCGMMIPTLNSSKTKQAFLLHFRAPLERPHKHFIVFSCSERTAQSKRDYYGLKFSCGQIVLKEKKQDSECFANELKM